MLASGHATSSTCELKQAKLESSMMNSIKVIKQNNTKPIMNYPRQFTIQHQQNMVTSNFPDFFTAKQTPNAWDLSSSGGSWKMTMLSTFRSPTSHRILVQCPAPKRGTEVEFFKL
jgi:hypothetical protein